MAQRLLALAAILVTAAAVVVYGRFASDPFAGVNPHDSDWVEPLYADTPEDAAARHRLEACAETCSRVVDCGLVPEIGLCTRWCEDEWSVETQECVAGAACDRIEEFCFADTEQDVCDRLCAHWTECRWPAEGETECDEFCREGLTREERECLVITGCDDDPLECLGEEERIPCPTVCDRLAECGMVDETEFTACLDMCRAELGQAARDCLLTYECHELEGVCMEGALPESLCAEACDTAINCGLASMTEEDCLLACEEEWDEDFALCLVDTTGCEEAEECFAEPGVECREVCDFLVGCEVLGAEEYEICVDACPEEFSEEERECIMAADCASVEACSLDVSAAPETMQDCEEVCARLHECGLAGAEDLLDCAQTCAESWTDERRACVAERECGQIAAECLTETAVP